MEVERLREVLGYFPDTGELRWKQRLSARVKVGAVAGSRQQRGYLMVSVDGKKLYAHRVAWAMHYGEWPKGELDHINRVKDDNRIENLREATRELQLRNTRTRSDNTSGQRGVSWHKGKWDAYINSGGARMHLGRHDTYEAAVAARKKAEADLVTDKLEELAAGLKEVL